MAGGTWIDQNKLRPGVYINYKSAPASLATMGERGVVAIARVLDWGERGRFYTIADPSDCEQFGHAITDDECLFIRQILLGTNRTQGASKIMLWSLEPQEGDTKASVTVKMGGVDYTITAKSAGPNGNKLSFSVTGSATFTFTVFNGDEVVSTDSNITDFQYVGSTAKTYLELPSSGSLAATPQTSLAGGAIGAHKATASIGNLVATAKYYGTFGNRLSVVITAGESANFIVQTLLDGQAVDSQVVSAISGLVANDYVEWSGTGALAANTGVKLTGGTNGEASITNYNAFLDALEVENFNIVIYDGTDATLKELYANYVKRLSNNEGAKCQAVVSNMTPNPDNECVINCYPQSITLSDGTVLAPEHLTWWMGGAQAGANVNESLTYANHPGAVDISPKLGGLAQDASITDGKIALFCDKKGRVKVLTDINSFRTFSVGKGKAFAKNRVVRCVFGFCNDIFDVFSEYYIGAVSNDEEGRKALKGECLGLANRYQGIKALQNVETDDFDVLKGVDSDAVVIEGNIQPVDSIEKIYINITIRKG